MSRTTEVCSSPAGTSTVVLLARLVDRAGANVKRSEVSAIRYSVYVRDSRSPDRRLAAIAEHDAVQLDVDEVMLDEPRTGNWWKVDAVGYNFRHAIEFRNAATTLRRLTRLQVCYELNLTSGSKSIIRSQLRTSK